MDIELLRTFLEVNRTRHFRKAADELAITQAAVSARIRLLEELAGVALFTRGRNNIQLTDAGQKLKGHAESMLNTWNRARREIALEVEQAAPLSVGAGPSLWDVTMVGWVGLLFETIPGLSLRTELSDPAALMRRVRDGSLDIALTYDAPRLRDLKAEPFATMRLVMVSSEPMPSAAAAVGANYALVERGAAFDMAHAEAFPHPAVPVLRVDSPRLARSFVLDRGGCAYLEYPLVTGDIGVGRLYPVPDAPAITLPTFAAYDARSGTPERLQAALHALRRPADASHR